VVGVPPPGAEPGIELVPAPAAAVVDVGADVVVGVSRATTCDELPTPQAARVTAKPVHSVAVATFPGFMSSLLVRKTVRSELSVSIGPGRGCLERLALVGLIE
jgi:hypothetical protein